MNFGFLTRLDPATSRRAALTFLPVLSWSVPLATKPEVGNVVASDDIAYLCSHNVFDMLISHPVDAP